MRAVRDRGGAMRNTISFQSRSWTIRKNCGAARFSVATRASSVPNKVQVFRPLSVGPNDVLPKRIKLQAQAGAHFREMMFGNVFCCSMNHIDLQQR
jgi:hypothetical protein